MATEVTQEQQIWVTTREGMEQTGYSHEYVEKLANKNFHLPEAERLIKTRKRSGRYELWLPDLLRYMTESGTGPMTSTKK